MLLHAPISPITLPSMRRALATAALLVLSPAWGGCGGDDVPQSAPGSADGSTAADASAEAEGPSTKDVAALIEALASRDPSVLAEAKNLVAPGSVAELYLQHQLEQAEASTDAGNPPEADKLTPKGGGEFESCQDDECVTWGGIEAEGEKTSSLTVNGKQLKDRLLAGNGQKIKLGRLGDAELLSAYESAGGSLIVCLRIKNASANSIAIESRTSYRSAEGRQSAVGGQTGPVALQPNSLAYFALAFGGAKLGGDLHLEMFSEDGDGPSGSARIPLR